MIIKSIKQEVSDIYIVEKSKFIAFILPIVDEVMATSRLNEIKKQYQDATHVCYAFILNDNGVLKYKCSDDGEPASTAGQPILNILKMNNLENVLAIVVRYFGGIKLGAGGLIRAYSNATNLALKKCEESIIKDCPNYKLTFPYNLINQIDNYLKNLDVIIKDKKYEIEVEYILIFKNDDIDKLKNKFYDNLKIEYLYDTKEII